MRDAVRASWLDFTEPLEGGVPWLYADIRGLITIAYGNLVDPLSSALMLPLMHPGGVRASLSEITTAWLSVKGDALAASRGHLYAKSLTSLRLTREGMSDLALAKLETNDAILRGRIDGWEELPACAQMAIHSLSWACGAMFNFPKLLSAIAARDYDAASVHIRMNETTPEGTFNAGLVARNRANAILVRNAARVQAYKLDPDTLDWTALIGVHDLPTISEVPNPASEPTVIVHIDPGTYLRPDDEPPDSAA
jgi:GH24 family phage-related lysozyme (muramidase)